MIATTTEYSPPPSLCRSAATRRESLPTASQPLWRGGELKRQGEKPGIRLRNCAREGGKPEGRGQLTPFGRKRSKDSTPFSSSHSPAASASGGGGRAEVAAATPHPSFGRKRPVSTAGPAPSRRFLPPVFPSERRTVLTHGPRDKVLIYAVKGSKGHTEISFLDYLPDVSRVRVSEVGLVHSRRREARTRCGSRETIRRN